MAENRPDIDVTDGDIGGWNEGNLISPRKVTEDKMMQEKTWKYDRYIKEDRY